jgi:hypothetical protein
MVEHLREPFETVRVPGADCAKLHLRPEHERRQSSTQRFRHSALQNQQQTLVADANYAEERAHASLRRKPRAPLPLPGRERTHVAGKLRVGERDRVGAGYFEHLR